MSVSAVQLGNKTFAIGFSDADNERRRQYFLDHSTQLTDQEQALLDALGIDVVMENILRLDLPIFFQKLAQCNSDASLVLKKECEIPYYVIWTTLLKNGQETSRRLKENQKITTGVSDISDAVTSQLISDLRPARKNVIEQLFTLMIVSSVPEELEADLTIEENATVSRNVLNTGVAIDKLFTLII